MFNRMTEKIDDTKATIDKGIETATTSVTVALVVSVIAVIVASAAIVIAIVKETK